MVHAVRVGVAVLALCFAAASMQVIRGRQQTYSPSSSTRYPAQPDGCPIEVFSTPPQRAYEELGTYDFDYTDAPAYEHLTTLSEVKQQVGVNACRLGGNALIGFARSGVYDRAVVIRWREQEAPAAATPPLPPSPNQTVLAPDAPSAGRP